MAGGLSGSGHGRDETGDRHPDDAQPDNTYERDCLQAEQRSDSLRPTQPGKCRERENGAAHRECHSAGQRDHAVVADHDARRGQTVNGEQRGHHREGRAHEHDPAVTPLYADDRERDGRHRRHDGTDADADEVHVGPESVGVLPEEVEARAGDHGARSEEREVLDHAIARKRPHQTPIGCDARHVEGQST